MSYICWTILSICWIQSSDVLLHKVLAYLFTSYLISSESEPLLSNAEHSTVHGEMQGIFHTNHQLDAHQSVLRILSILHNQTKINILRSLVFLQETMKHSSIIRNTFYSIITSIHSFTAYTWGINMIIGCYPRKSTAGLNMR